LSILSLQASVTALTKEVKEAEKALEAAAAEIEETKAAAGIDVAEAKREAEEDKARAAASDKVMTQQNSGLSIQLRTG